MYGFTPDHALQSALTFVGYFGLPMVARYDKSTKEYIKASNDYIFQRLINVIGAYLYTGALYSLYILYPNLFPQMGPPYEPGYFKISRLLTLRSLRDTAFWIRKLRAFQPFIYLFYHCIFVSQRRI